jgi:hypothetical protein
VCFGSVRTECGNVFGDAVDVQGEAARGNVAYVLAQAVDDPEWRGRTVLMASA